MAVLPAYLAELQQEFRDASGLGFSFITVLYEGAMHGDLADAAIAQAWDEQGVDRAYPILADPASIPITEAVPTWPGAVSGSRALRGRRLRRQRANRPVSRGRRRRRAASSQSPMAAAK